MTGLRLAALIAGGLFLALLWPSGSAQAARVRPICEGGTAPEAGGAGSLSAADLSRRSGAAGALLTGGADDPERALSLLDLALPAGHDAGDIDIARYCLIAGEAMRRSPRGSQTRAQTFLRTALGRAELAGDRDLAGTAAWRLALAIIGGPPPARNAVRTGATEDLAPPERSLTSDCFTLARTSALYADNRRVIQLAFGCALRRAREAGDHRLAALAGLRLARQLGASAVLATEGGEALSRAAADVAIDALPDAAVVSDPAEQAELITRLAEIAIDHGAAADPRLPPAMAAARAAGDASAGGRAAALALSARSALALGDAGAARALLSQAIFAEGQRPVPLRLAEWWMLMARADPSNMAAHVDKAYETLELVRPLLPRVDALTEESLFDLSIRPVFEQAMASRLSIAQGDAPDAIAAAQRIAEAYRKAELQNALGPDCVPVRDPVRPADLKPGEILLYPLLLEDRVELIYAAGGDGEARYRRLPPNPSMGRAQVTALAQRMTRAMSEGTEDWRVPAQTLYALLIAPLEGMLQPSGTLVIVPDGPLRGVSLAALTDGEGRFLIERTRLSVVPALSFAQPGNPGGSGRSGIVAASLEREVDLPVGRFPMLAGTGEEARIAAGAKGVVLADFTKADLATALARQRVTVLHLATHAAFNGRSDRSFIVTNGDTLSLPELRLLLSRNQARGDTLHLLVLSACETAVGDNDEGMGLAGAAVEAGAQSAIASFWQVSDAGTLALMRAFYDRYRAGEGRAEALRAAQVALIRSGDPTLADPGVWGAFALLGSWR